MLTSLRSVQSAPAIPPTNPALRPLVRMVAEAIQQFGTHQTAILCLAAAAGMERAAELILAGDAAHAAIIREAGVTVCELRDMAGWLTRRAHEMAGPIQ